jgi:hypothetical protein
MPIMSADIHLCSLVQHKSSQIKLHTVETFVIDPECDIPAKMTTDCSFIAEQG